MKRNCATASCLVCTGAPVARGVTAEEPLDTVFRIFTSLQLQVNLKNALER